MLKNSTPLRLSARLLSTPLIPDVVVKLLKFVHLRQDVHFLAFSDLNRFVPVQLVTAEDVAIALTSGHMREMKTTRTSLPGPRRPNEPRRLFEKQESAGLDKLTRRQPIEIYSAGQT